MQTLSIQKKKIDFKNYVQRRASETDCKTLIKDEFKLIDQQTGKIVCLYVLPQEDDRLDELFRTCLEVKYTKNFRTNGLATTSRIFGYNPRNAIRKDFCSVSSLANEDQTQHEKILAGGAIAAKYYALHNKELYDNHLVTTQKKVVSDFQYPDLPFTSGIINDNNPLSYHFDSGNYNEVWSAMIVLKKDIKGGYLSMPEYDIMCEVKDKSIFFFDGQNILHGVTPITKLKADSRRFSIVYYSLKNMWNCLPLREEIARARNRRQLVETNRLAKNKKP
jgi:hypothetical protein